MVKLLVFAGSARQDSLNKKLAKVITKEAINLGAEATFVDLADYSMPLYDGDLESQSGLPEGAQKFKAVLTEHDAVIIASPEYNGAFSPLLKNTLDWASRAESDSEKPLSAYAKKTAAIVAASPGKLGGLRGLVHLRMLLTNLGVHVIPKQFALSQAHNAFDEGGNLSNDRDLATIQDLIQQLNRLTNAIK